MPRFHFHFHDGDGCLHDLDGHDLPDLDAVRDEAVRCARDIMSDEIRTGRLDLRYRLEVDDDSGRPVLTLGFDEALEIICP